MGKRQGIPKYRLAQEHLQIFSVSIDQLLSGEELLTLAQTENRANVRKLYSLLWGILDTLAIVFILLPLYGNPVDGYVYSVNLPAFTDTTPADLAIYWVVFTSMIGLGIAKLIFTSFENEMWGGILVKSSLVLNIFAVCFFAAAREPYAVTPLSLIHI